MKRKRLILAISITALIVAVVLISLEAYYVAVALIVGTLLMGHRELWSLIKRRKLPPVDERVRENINKSVRNGFIFLAITLAFLMLPFGTGLIQDVSIVSVLSGLFLSGGTVYLLSYLFYDRAEPRLGEKGLRVLRRFLMVTGISFGVFIISVFLHNAIYALFILWFGEGFWDRIGIGDEPVFFFVALLSVVALAVGVIGSLVIFTKGLLSKAP